MNIEIDKLTRSIENAVTGDSFRTEVIPLTKKDLRALDVNDWLFNWQRETQNGNKVVYKLVIMDNPNIIQGLMSIEDRGDHIFMHTIESNKFNRGKRKVYLGVPGNLVAFACKTSFDKGYDGFVSFESKSKLIPHYKSLLGAESLFGNYMAIGTTQATRLVQQYFPRKD